MTVKIGTIRMERNRAIKGQKDMRKSNRELTRELAASRALCDQHFNTIIELRSELGKVLTRTDAMIPLPIVQTRPDHLCACMGGFARCTQPQPCSLLTGTMPPNISLQKQHGECNECGKKQADGFALYCVECADSALIGCQYPLCKSETEQKDIAEQVHTGPGTPSARLGWILQELSNIFPEYHDKFSSAPPENTYLKHIADLQAQKVEAKDEAIRKLSEALRLSWSKMYVSGVEARRLSDEALQLPIVLAITGEANEKP